MSDEPQPSPAPEPAGSVRPLRTVGVSALVVVLAVAAAVLAPVRIDGRWREVGFSTVGGMADAGQLRSHPGDLLSAAPRHRVIRKGGGRPAVVYVGGHAVSADTRPWPWQVVTTLNGTDTIESTKTLGKTIDAPVRVVGTGAMQDIANEGQPGAEEVEVGTVSGDVVEVHVITPAEPLIVWRVDSPSAGKVVSLTFDDGPWPGQTQAILDILKREGVRATFFEIGQEVAVHPDLSRMVLADGMALGNHTQTHVLLGRLPHAPVYKEIADAQGSIKKATGFTPHWFRPPGGSMSATVYQVAAKLGVRPVLWSVDPNDWTRPPVSVIVTRVLSHVHPGAVVLMHDGGGIRTNTIAALPTIIDALKRQGYTFLTLDQFPGAQGSGRLAVW